MLSRVQNSSSGPKMVLSVGKMNFQWGVPFALLALKLLNMF
jgi:hypothetical protein